MPADVAVVLVKTPSRGGFLVPDVPFPHPISLVPGGLESLGQRHALLVQLTQIGRTQPVGRIPTREVRDASLMRVQARKQGGPGGTATGGIIILGKAQAIGRETI